MPIYEYECLKCGVTFETMQSISAKPLKTCMGMGCNNKDKGKVRRLISATGFILKGSGWYATDYPSEARKKGMEQEAKAAQPEKSSKDTATKSTENTETKPVDKKTSPKKTVAGGKKKDQNTPKTS